MQLVDYRVEFSKWWVTEFKTIKFPSAGTLFDYFVDPETKKFVPWSERVPKFELDPEIPLQVENTILTTNQIGELFLVLFGKSFCQDVGSF